ncbi:MAG: response regulator transcription factor [Hungatella sp.]|nr:response regulator transcription factor [Hungatella sp.]
MMELYYAEDDSVIANLVKDYLARKNIRVTVCPTLAYIRQALKAHVPSMILLDWNMPDGGGDAFCQWARSKWKNLPIIILTVRSDPHDIVSGFRRGADDYVAKPFELEVLYSRIQALLRRTGDVASEYLSCDGIVIDQNRRLVSCHSKEVGLSTSEYELLLYLMENKGKTLTRENILEQVWDVKGNYVNNNTLTVTLKRLRDKLGQPPCLKTVRSVGYRMEDTL